MSNKRYKYLLLHYFVIHDNICIFISVTEGERLAKMIEESQANDILPDEVKWNRRINFKLFFSNTFYVKYLKYVNPNSINLTY